MSQVEIKEAALKAARNVGIEVAGEHNFSEAGLPSVSCFLR